ncbi:hypothetical protein X975_13343, partial [Stegodyphus mimosarum]
MPFSAPVVISRKTINNDVPNQDAGTNTEASTSFVHQMTDLNEFENFNSVMGSDEIKLLLLMLTKMADKTQENSSCRTDVPCSLTSVAKNMNQPITPPGKEEKET